MPHTREATFDPVPTPRATNRVEEIREIVHIEEGAGYEASKGPSSGQALASTTATRSRLRQNGDATSLVGALEQIWNRYRKESSRLRADRWEGGGRNVIT